MAKGKASIIVLSVDEQQELESLTRRRSTGQALALRARIVLAAAKGGHNRAIAERLRIARGTVGKWRERFARLRLDGLYDEPRPGAPRQIGDAEIADTIRRTLETRPPGATHWSLRTMAKAVGHAPSTIHRIWRAFGLQPHRSETFKLSADPLFVEKVRDIVGLYLDPPERAVVLCVDEKSQIQALDRTQPLLPMRPGQSERRTHDYKRHGTLSLFAALDVQVGKVIGRCFRRHRAREFRKFLDTVEANVRPDSTCTSSWTTPARIRPSSSATGSPSARVGTSTSPRPRPPGSARSSASSHCSPIASSAAAPIARPLILRVRSMPTSTPIMPSQSPFAGPSPLTTSSAPSTGSAFALSKP